MPLALATSRGELDLDLGAECAGDFFERRQRHAIVSFPLQTLDVGLLHTDPPREFGLGPAVFQPGSDQNLRENIALASPHCWQSAAQTSSMTLTRPPDGSLDKPVDLPKISTYGLWMLKLYETSFAPGNMNFPSTRMHDRLPAENGVKMARVYHKCQFCGGEVAEKLITVDYRWGEKLVTVINNVPAGVCGNCGEQYFKAPIVKAMERLARSKKRPKEMLKVPVRELKVT